MECHISCHISCDMSCDILWCNVTCLDQSYVTLHLINPTVLVITYKALLMKSTRLARPWRVAHTMPWLAFWPAPTCCLPPANRDIKRLIPVVCADRGTRHARPALPILFMSLSHVTYHAVTSPHVIARHLTSPHVTSPCAVSRVNHVHESCGMSLNASLSHVACRMNANETSLSHANETCHMSRRQITY